MAIVPSNGKVVLISGINGYIASNIGLDLLKKGYTVRGTSRSSTAKDALLEGPFKAYADRFEYYAVPDMTIPGAFDEAVKGVHAIQHTASPIDMSLKSLEAFLEPATKGVLSILHSAKVHAGPQLTSFVLTSSVAAVANPEKGQDYAFSEADWNTFAEAKSRELGNAKSSTALWYPASKTAAERVLWELVEKHHPSWSVSAVNPGLVTGPPVLIPSSPAKLNATLKPVWGLLSGEMKEVPPGVGSQSYIDVRDVSAMHIWCLEHPKESDGQRYLMAAGRGTMQGAADILRKAYPNNGVVVGEPGTGYLPDYDFMPGVPSFRSTKALKALGIQYFIKYDKSVLDTAKVFEPWLRTDSKV